MPYPLEMQALVDYLGENMPAASIAILRADDDFGAGVFAEPKRRDQPPRDDPFEAPTAETVVSPAPSSRASEKPAAPAKPKEDEDDGFGAGLL